MSNQIQSFHFFLKLPLHITGVASLAKCFMRGFFHWHFCGIHWQRIWCFALPCSERVLHYCWLYIKANTKTKWNKWFTKGCMDRKRTEPQCQDSQPCSLTVHTCYSYKWSMPNIITRNPLCFSLAEGEKKRDCWKMEAGVVKNLKNAILFY